LVHAQQWVITPWAQFTTIAKREIAKWLFLMFSQCCRIARGTQKICRDGIQTELDHFQTCLLLPLQFHLIVGELHNSAKQPWCLAIRLDRFTIVPGVGKRATPITPVAPI